MSLEEILKELSSWVDIRIDKRLNVTITRDKHSDVKVLINFFELSPDIPHLYRLGEKYVIMTQDTSFHYKGMYYVEGFVDSADNYVQLQKRI